MDVDVEVERGENRRAMQWSTAGLMRCEGRSRSKGDQKGHVQERSLTHPTAGNGVEEKERFRSAAASGAGY